MDLANLNGTALNGVERVNVILGKNGCGKSFLLKKIEPVLRGQEGVAQVRYISPERGGLVEYNADMEFQIARDPNWLPERRRQNQSSDFRTQSAALFRRIELIFLREVERGQFEQGYVPRSFDATVDALNELLERVYIKRDTNRAFTIHVRETEQLANPKDISSGESELISLGVEFLAFVAEAVPKKQNYLLVDEPDVHLHPDLQDRLAKFVVKALAGKPVTLLLATHSTALLRAFSEADARVAFMRRGDQNLTFKAVTAVDRAILPIFGAHPLSNIFNEAPILLVEGEDDERVWQQAVRSAHGAIKLYPCDVEGKGNFAEYETEVNNIIESVYDNARGFSLRDRDTQSELINDLGHIVRMRLSCRAAENLMLCGEVLAAAGTDWPSLQAGLIKWVGNHPEHQYCAHMQAFVDQGFDRKAHDLKEIRNILIGQMSNKPWEVLVGQQIAALAVAGGGAGDGSLRDFLGEKVCATLLHLPEQG